jgi:hypothetical protein
MASAAQIAAAQKLADEMAAAAEGEDSDDAPLESLVTVRHNGAADRDDASDDEVMPTPKRRGPPTDGDAALAAALDADLAARKPLPDFRRDGPRVGETIRRKVERPTGTAWAEGKIIGYLGPDESDFVDANGAKAALYRVRYESGLRELVGDEEDLCASASRGVFVRLCDGVEVERSPRRHPSPRHHTGKSGRSTTRPPIGRRSTILEGPPTVVTATTARP